MLILVYDVVQPPCTLPESKAEQSSHFKKLFVPLFPLFPFFPWQTLEASCHAVSTLVLYMCCTFRYKEQKGEKAFCPLLLLLFPPMSMLHVLYRVGHINFNIK